MHPRSLKEEMMGGEGGLGLFRARGYIHVTFGRASLFKFALPAMAFIADKANLMLSAKDGLVLRTMSGSRSGDIDAFLFIPSSVMTDFSCMGGAYTFGVDLLMLVDATEDAKFDQLVTLLVNPKTRKLTIELECLCKERRTSNVSSYPLQKEIKPAIDGVDPSKYEYDLAVGIPTEEFIRIFSRLEFGSPEVRIQISKNMLKIHVDKPIILRQELASCVIVGHLKEGSDVDFKFPALRLSSYLLVAKMTKMVWLCYSEDAPPMLNFAVGALGNIHIYSRRVPNNSKG